MCRGVLCSCDFCLVLEDTEEMDRALEQSATGSHVAVSAGERLHR